MSSEPDRSRGDPLAAMRRGGWGTMRYFLGFFPRSPAPSLPSTSSLTDERPHSLAVVTEVIPPEILK